MAATWFLHQKIVVFVIESDLRFIQKHVPATATSAQAYIAQSCVQTCRRWLLREIRSECIAYNVQDMQASSRGMPWKSSKSGQFYFGFLWPRAFPKLPETGSTGWLKFAVPKSQDQKLRPLKHLQHQPRQAQQIAISQPEIWNTLFDDELCCHERLLRGQTAWYQLFPLSANVVATSVMQPFIT